MLSVSVSDAASTGSVSNSRTLATYSYGNSVNNGLLQSMTYGNNATVSYEYDIFDRTTKETYNNGVEYNYAYDASGALAKHWSSTNSSDTVMEEYRYEYILNAQGDVVALMNETGSVVADYTYDEWGKLISVTGSNTAMGNINPLRYRGYIYDTEGNSYY